MEISFLVPRGLQAIVLMKLVTEDEKYSGGWPIPAR